MDRHKTPHLPQVLKKDGVNIFYYILDPQMNYIYLNSCSKDMDTLHHLWVHLHSRYTYMAVYVSH